jgi:DNA sulfur modification protein DndC
MEWANNDLGFFDLDGLNAVTKTGKDLNIAPELLKKIIDIEVEVSGLGNRRGLTDKIEKVLRQDWGNLEDAFSDRLKSNNAINEFKNKREDLQVKLGEFS